VSGHLTASRRSRSRSRRRTLVCIVLLAGNKRPSRALFGSVGERILLFRYPMSETALRAVAPATFRAPSEAWRFSFCRTQKMERAGFLTM
jgi:hypothetical protein